MRALYIVAFCFFFIPVVHGLEVIRDSEIEETLYLIVDPIKKSANLPKLQIYIINDDNANAFTMFKDVIYINSGLIVKYPNIDILRGVMAHEVGHIVGHHLVRQLSNIDSYKTFNFTTSILGVLASVLVGDSNLAIAGYGLGEHIPVRAFLSHSRTNEYAADQTALKLLEASHCSCVGMIELFESFSSLRDPKLINSYVQTHPLDQERISIIRDFCFNSKYRNAKNSDFLSYRLNRASAKLRAFTDNNPKSLLRGASKSYSKDIAKYVQSICYFRMHDMKNSIAYINELIESNPQDPFYNELKAQILFEFGNANSINFYDIASNFRPNDELIELSRAIVGITIYSNKAELKPFKTVLDKIILQNPDNILSLQYLAIYYGKIGANAKAQLTSAIIYSKTGELKKAKLFAKYAIKKLKKDSSAWYKANDIILMKDDQVKDIDN
ncbi:MAG: M48 family metalloprotease [Rickettsiaceae bacterium]